MEVCIRGAEASILRADEAVVPWVFVEATGHIVKLVEIIRVVDVDFAGADAYNRS